MTDASEASGPIIPVLADYLEAYRDGLPSNGFYVGMGGWPILLHLFSQRTSAI
jgi:hypothetical protein